MILYNFIKRCYDDSLKILRKLFRFLISFYNEYLLPSLGLGKNIKMGEGSYISGKSRISCNRLGSINIRKKVMLKNATIRVGENSTLVIGDHCNLDNVYLLVTDGSMVTIGDDATIQRTTIIVQNEGSFRTESGCILKSSFDARLDNGSLIFGSKSYSSARFHVRFGGKIKVGSNTGIGSGTWVRCEEEITIGDYCLISYDCLIFDTNTHSTDWKKRRDRIEAGYPNGTTEIEKENPKPISIGNDVWIGARSIILKDTCIGNRTIVGMGTSVSGNIPKDSIVVSTKPRVIIKDDMRVG
ncbi:MAG: acyltransferase [Anaerolineales bacterium]|jgi:acetyltransferase-like isoleucine patch superfamily enzyme|nr:acyltransferase [Anaerolineales bacterium]